MSMMRTYLLRMVALLMAAVGSQMSAGVLQAQSLTCENVIREPYLLRSAYEEGRFQEILEMGQFCDFKAEMRTAEKEDLATNIRSFYRYLIMSCEQLGEGGRAVLFMQDFLSLFPQYQFNKDADSYLMVQLASKFEVMKKREWGIQSGYHRSMPAITGSFVNRFDLGLPEDQIVGPELEGVGGFSVGFQRMRSFSPRHQIGMEFDYNQNSYRIATASASFSADPSGAILGDWRQSFQETVHVLEFPLYYRHRYQLGAQRRLRREPGYFRLPKHWLIGTAGISAGFRLHSTGEVSTFLWENDDQGNPDLRESVFNIAPMTDRRRFFQGALIGGLGYERETEVMTIGGSWNFKVGTTNIRRQGTRNDIENEILIWNHHVTENDFFLHKWMDISLWVRFPLQSATRGYEVIPVKE